MSSFALVGAAGYVAPRHLRAIRDTGHQLVAASDLHDSVGVLDHYFPNAAFFTEIERFDRHLSKLKQNGPGIDFLTVCSPSYLHDAHIRFGLRLGADVICEKPLVLNPWNLEGLQEVEKETGGRAYSILQLRLHPAIVELKRSMDRLGKNSTGKHDVRLTYITPRGKWYYASWKGQDDRSGGIATNIGIHFFDMLQWIFGNIQENRVHLHTHDRAAGFLELEQARVQWFLSINADTLPVEVKEQGGRTFRSIEVDGEAVEFSAGFEDLHTRSYEEILADRGFSLEQSMPAIQAAFQIRNSDPVGLTGDHHPLAALARSRHPFQAGPGIQQYL